MERSLQHRARVFAQQGNTLANRATPESRHSKQADGHKADDTRLGDKTYGTLSAGRDNVIVLPTFYSGTHERNEGYLKTVPVLDPARYFIVNDLLAKPWTWQQGDISANNQYRGNFESALAAIRARAILIPCTTDLYFPQQNNAFEARHMPNAQLRPYESAWGHCVATPGRDRAFMAFLNECATELLRAQETRREKCHGQRVHEDGRS